MAAYTRNCYPMAVQAVRDAISKDSDGQTKEAYCCYLSGILFMVQALKDEAWDRKEMKELCHDSSMKLYKLIEQSLGRARDILSAQNSDCNESHHAKPKEPLTSSLSAPSQSHSRPSSPRLVVQNTDGLIASLPTPPGVLPSPPGSPYSPSLSTVSTNHQAQNYDMFRAYQMRKSKDSILQKYQSCNQNMSLFREMAEKKKLSDIKQKAYQEKMLKRRQEIKIEAERRWNQMNRRSSRDKEYRQDLLESILAYEEEARWPITMRDTLAINCEDTSTITKVVRTMLTYNDHPLCRVLKEIQYEIYSNIEPLLKDFNLPSELADDYYLVPVEDVTNRTRGHTMPTISGGDDEDYYDNTELIMKERRTESVASHTTVAPTKTNLDNSLENKFIDLEDDMFSSDSENEDLEAKPYNVLQNTKSSENKSGENVYSENEQGDNVYNRLWQVTDTTDQTIPTRVVVGESGNEEEPIYQDPVVLHSTTDPSNYERLTAYQENIYEDVNEVVASIIRNEHSARSISPVTLNRLNSDFLKTLDRVIQDILFGLDRLHSVILLTYESMDNAVGRDVSYANLECIFFKPLWPWLIRLFRKMNIDKEDAMAEVMRTYKNCGPSIINIRDKLSLGGDQDADKEPYLEAIEEMKQVVQFTSPLDKLECTVRVSKAICHCVETFYTEKGERAPAVGCDDLLPILSYVVLKSQLPQIVSECHAMTEFIHDGYLMGEEGYCLTTLHAAISNLLSYAKPRV